MSTRYCQGDCEPRNVAVYAVWTAPKSMFAYSCEECLESMENWLGGEVEKLNR